ncbi:MAG: MOSC domain-containing protein [Chloroflexota bacterium]
MEAVRTLEALESAFAQADPAPTDSGTVEMIICRPAHGERDELDSTTLDPEKGMIGDNWLTRGSRHTEDGSANPEAQITLMNSRIIALLAKDRDDWAPAGDQFFVDFDLSQINMPTGQRFQLGEAILEVSATPHTGCAKFTERYGSAAIRFVNSKEGRSQNRRGINAKIITGGTVKKGDTIHKLED